MYEELKDMAFHAGADGFCHKDSDVNDLLAGIKRIVKDEIFVCNR